MTETYAQDAWARRNPRARRAVKADGLPAPTGYFPDRSWPDQGQASFSAVFDEQYGPARQEVMGGERVDQHPYLQVSATITAAPEGARKDGRHDPMEDGPASPTLRLLGLFYAHAQGTDQTHYLDAPGIRFPSNGSQDGASWTYYEDPRLQLLDYNPDPAAGDGEMPDTLRALPPSPPHGWAEQTALNARAEELAKMKKLKGQRAPHQDRLANSTYAGQTYSARTAHVGQTSGSAPSWRGRG